MEVTQNWNLVSEIQLVYKSKIKASLRPKVKGSNDCYEIFMKHWDLNKIELVEEFKILFLNQNGRAMAIYALSEGGMTATVADPKLVFCAALKANACSMILCHNHPSGGLKPSSADQELTSKFREAGKFLDIKVLDHLIISSEGFYSFADEGLL